MASPAGLSLLFEADALIAYGLSPVSDADGPRLTLADEVLERLARHRQRRRGAREAGGQLFGRVRSGGNLDILAATGPRQGDRRGRFSFRPDRSAERDEIAEMYGRGLDYVGDWHTHPEGTPTASGVDLQSIAEIARQSRHTVGPLVLLVVGTASPPAGLCVCLHDGVSCLTLVPAQLAEHLRSDPQPDPLQP